MNIHVAHQSQSGLTRLEVLVILTVLVILGILFWPRFGSRQKVPRIHCVNNLKQTGRAFRIWSGDHNDKYPMAVSVTNGGTMELMGGEDAWRMYQVMSNELSTPKILICPADEEHQPPAANFSDDLKGKISYFINPDASDVDPQFIVSGDDNFVIGGSPVKPGLLEISSRTSIAWSIHCMVGGTPQICRQHPDG